MAGNNKKDMSATCGFQYDTMRTKAFVTKEISIEEWESWYKDHCSQCQYMCEICMYGEE